MSKLLSQEDKIYLGRICRYLGSIGMTEGTVEIDEIESGYRLEDVDWNQITHFSNNYTAEVPPGLIPIFEKIGNYISENDLVPNPDVDSLDWERLEIKIDCDTSEISASYDYGYTTAGDSSGTEWDVEDDELLEEIFRDLEDIEPDNDDELVLDYNGSGDSGFVESSFNNGGDVPSSIEEWCYDQLESQYGGWEINEGSQGTFTFNMKNKTISLEHVSNIQESNYDTIWEEKF